MAIFNSKLLVYQRVDNHNTTVAMHPPFLSKALFWPLPLWGPQTYLSLLVLTEFRDYEDFFEGKMYHDVSENH